eukprot:5725591-Amphidinium_carterae.1
MHVLPRQSDCRQATFILSPSGQSNLQQTNSKSMHFRQGNICRKVPSHYKHQQSKSEGANSSKRPQHNK